MSLTELSLGGTAGDENVVNLFLQCSYLGGDPDIGEGESTPWRVPF
jgi:hypothetical protein